MSALYGEEYCYWHKEEIGKKPNKEQLEELKHNNIIFAYLKDAHLIDADLEGSCLEYANLQNAVLEHANLKKANLKKANLQNAHLGNADLKKANLSSVNLAKSFLEDANLQKADLSYSKLCEIKARRSNFTDCILKYTDFKKSDLKKVIIKNANLENANLSDSYLKLSNFEESKLNKANLQNSDLTSANFKRTNLNEANLEQAYLKGVNLEQSYLRNSNLKLAYLEAVELNETDLTGAFLQEAYLNSAHLQGANLKFTSIQGAKLGGANFTGANFYGARFDSKTILDESKFNYANLFRSFFDEAKSFRNIDVNSVNSKYIEINEIAGIVNNKQIIKIFNSLGPLRKFIMTLTKYFPFFSFPCILDLQVIEKKAPDVFNKLKGNGLIRYISENDRIIFFDIFLGKVITNPINNQSNENCSIYIEGLSDLVIKNGKIQRELLYKENHNFLYEVSYEVYNNLYNFYIANGVRDKVAHVHYRREETLRKLRWKKGGKKRLRSIFDLLISRSLTGYGDKIERPIIFSFFFIFLFGVLFKLTDGIVKTVNGNIVEPDWIDYFYHSITTFTSLGYSNIQPNLGIGHLPQLLVSIESVVGITMMALFIFVITYQVSR